MECGGGLFDKYRTAIHPTGWAIRTLTDCIRNQSALPLARLCRENTFDQTHSPPPWTRTAHPPAGPDQPGPQPPALPPDCRPMIKPPARRPPRESPPCPDRLSPDARTPGRPHQISPGRRDPGRRAAGPKKAKPAPDPMPLNRSRESPQAVVIHSPPHKLYTEKAEVIRMALEASKRPLLALPALYVYMVI